MMASLSWWELDESDQTIESLRDYLRDEGVQPWESVAGLLLKFWISDTSRNRWGAVMLWDSARSARQDLPPNRAAALIGYPPAERFSFDVEATAEGIHTLSTLGGLGPALEHA